MRIEFTPNPRPTVGVELELHLVDESTGDLVSASCQILDEMAGRLGVTEHPKAKPELFQSTIELITGVCNTPSEVRADLQQTLDEASAVAARMGVRLASSGTHPFAMARAQDVSPSPRYHALIESMQWPARRLLTCGLHVHVGVRDGARSIAIINELRRHLPLFVALSASSPFFEGEDSGLASARSKIFENLPTAGLPPLIEGWTDFEEFMATLIRTNCIESIREVWWDLRPHPDFGTVELRMCDAPPTVDEAVALAALAQTLVAWCDERIDAGELAPPARDWTVRENRWLAARYGLEAELIVESADREHPVRRPARALVEELLDVLAPTAAVLGADDELAGVRSIVERGSGTWRQRMVVEAGGTLHDVVDLLVDELAGKRRR